MLILAIDPNVVNSGAEFLVAGDCVRAIPLNILHRNKNFRFAQAGLVEITYVITELTLSPQKTGPLVQNKY